ncbi:tyrosine recombinase XerC [Streptomyces canus]|uniref:site-specific integrase n=1 Tax=Streptomyces canus TaxID=58343 RepID=UPI0038667F0E
MLGFRGHFSPKSKTEASTATLPLPQICVTVLQLRLRGRELAKGAAGELWTDSDFVFTTRHGTPYKPRNFNRLFVARSAKEGVRRIRPHDTRHTCGSLLAALNVHPRVAMQILRHSKIGRNCCTSPLYGMPKPLPGIPGRGFELRGPVGI